MKWNKIKLCQYVTTGINICLFQYKNHYTFSFQINACWCIDTHRPVSTHFWLGTINYKCPLASVFLSVYWHRSCLVSVWHVNMVCTISIFRTAFVFSAVSHLQCCVLYLSLATPPTCCKFSRQPHPGTEMMPTTEAPALACILTH